MEKICSLMVAFTIVAVGLQDTAAQTVHVVGDNVGWTVPQGSQVYPNWTAGKKFFVGDILVFNFRTNEHDVVAVPKASYDACTSDNSTGSIITTGPANVTLDSVGDHFYICTIGRHCAAGQKLSITVVSATPGASPPSSTTPTTPPTTTPTPPSPTGTPEACAPTPKPQPSSPPPGGNGPTAESPPPPGSNSSRSSVACGLVSFLFMVFGLLV